MRRCKVTARYAKWAGLDPWEPRWGWIWMLALHLVVAGGALMWTAVALWVFWRFVG